MSRLLYFRHAQASFGKADYDQLSELGYEQSSVLGQHLVTQEVQFDHIYVGPLKRHHQTLSKVVEAYKVAGVPLPDIQEIKELEEHRGPEILKTNMSKIRDFDPQIRQWDEERIEDPSLFTKNGLLIFERAMEMWATGALEHLQPEQYLNWADFRKQVSNGYEYVLDKHKHERGKTIGLFTSGGTISAIMGRVLGIESDRDVIRLNGIVQNTSITEVLYSEHRATLKRFNEVSHLPEKMHTYV